MTTSTASIAQALDFIPEKKANLRKAYEDLVAVSSALSSFTLQWSDLDSHFSSLESSLRLRLDQLKSLETTPNDKNAPTTQPEEEEDPSRPEPRPELVGLCVKMDGKGLRGYVDANRKELAAIKEELGPAIRKAPDPGELVLDAVEGSHGERRTCLLLLERLCSVKPNIKEEVKEKARRVAKEWKGRIGDPVGNSVEAMAFLQLVAAFGLGKEFGFEEIAEVVVPIAKRKPVVDICRSLDLGDKINDLIEKLNRKKKHLEAVRFIFAFDLMENFPPVPLLKAAVKEAKKTSQEVRRKGKHSAQARNEAVAKEISALKLVIKAIEEHKLQSEYPTESLEKQVSRLEQMKAEKKRPATNSAPVTKGQQIPFQKRPRPDMGSAAAGAAAYPLGPVMHTQPPLSLAERSAYLSSASHYGLAGPSGVNRSSPKPYLYPSESHTGSIRYDRPPPIAYDNRLGAYESRAATYDNRPVGYDNRPVNYEGGAYDNVPAAYDSRAAVYGSYNLPSGLPPQYTRPQLP